MHCVVVSVRKLAMETDGDALCYRLLLPMYVGAAIDGCTSCLFGLGQVSADNARATHMLALLIRDKQTGRLSGN